MHKRPENTIWRHIKSRCYNQRDNAYRNYGGRGIQVCQEWRDSFEAFIKDVGFRPSPELTLDRINNDGHYEPGNVRWTTRKTQAANTRLTREERSRRGRINAMKRWHPESH